jgi:hypothetical protein
MTIQMKIARTPVFLILGGMSALVLGLLASTRSLMGWALAVWGTGLLIESLGLSHHLVHPNVESRGMGTQKEKMTMAGILAVSIIPALDFLALPALLPRTAWIQDAGLMLCALGVLILLRSKISWESWIGGDIPMPAIRREIDGGPNHANRFLEYAGAVLWAMGICIGFGSLAGIAAATVLLIPGLLPEKSRER